MNRTGIEWCDYTWNPIVGCSPISAGCAHCYAETMARRFGSPWGKAHFKPERLTQPQHVHKPARVFVCSVSDLGHDTVMPEWRSQVYAAMWAAPQHRYLILTKRPGPWLEEVPETVWCGVSVESEQYAARVDALEVWAAGKRKFISAEPLLGPLPQRIVRRVDWVIAGPETGSKARPCNPLWIRDLFASCVVAVVPFFDKRPGADTVREWPLSLEVPR